MTPGPTRPAGGGLRRWDLTGPWRAAPADEELRRRFPAADFDDAGWESVTVPGHWQTIPAFADEQGPLLYRTAFSSGTAAPEERTWLTLQGCFYEGDVWLDGAYVGDTEGYFAPHSFEVTDLLEARSEHLLGVEVTCSPTRDLTAKRNLTGVFQHWDALDLARNPGGLWRPVTLTTTGPVAIATMRVVVLEADQDRAIVQVDASLDADAARTVELHTVVEAAGDTAVGSGVASAVGSGVGSPLASAEEQHSLSVGTNHLTWRLAVEAPRLWWPRVLGSQPLHDLHVEVRVEGEVSDHRTRRVGLRKVDLDDWVASVNGERLFLKGAVYGPTRPDIGNTSDAELARDLDLAVDGGIDFLRLIAHISHPRLYDLADERGVLLWQELPLQWAYARGVRGRAIRQAVAAVDLLGHHASVFAWCGHNEPFPSEARPGHWPQAEVTRRFTTRGLGRQGMPSWNRTVLDRSLKRALERADPSRPVIAHSGVLPHPPTLDGTDTHLWFGWFHGTAADLGVLAARLPRLVRFVSEFGAQSVPEHWPLPDAWPPTANDVAALADAGLHLEVATARLPFETARTSQLWADATRRYQAQVVKTCAETLRRLKYRPTGGCAVFMLADCQPGISAALLDHERRPKPAWDALRDAYQPVIVVADPLPSPLRAGQEVRLSVHVVSDLRKPLNDANLDVALLWGTERLEWRFGGDIEPDSVTRVGRLAFSAPTVSGRVVLDLRLLADGLTVTNSYVGRVAAQ
jgi:beta-mannosidase